MNYDVIVIGGGIIGATTTYELAKQGLRVALVEKKHVASGASGKSAAMLELQTDSFRGEPFLSLAKASDALFPGLYEEIKTLTGIDFEYERCGILQLALSEEDESALKKNIDQQNAVGLPAAWWDSKKIQSAIPRLNKSMSGGAFYPKDGQVDGLKFTEAMIKAARMKGARIEQNVDQIEFDYQNNRVVGLKSSRGPLQADSIVIAAGAWTDTLLDEFNVKTGITPVKGQLLVYNTPDRILPFPLYTRSRGYITPKKTTTLVGSTIENTLFDDSISTLAKDQLAFQAMTILPEMWKLKPQDHIAALRPGSPDELPFLDRVHGHPNIIVAAGHYRNGILLAPITGKVVTCLIQSQTPPVDIAPFSVDRKKVLVA